MQIVTKRALHSALRTSTRIARTPHHYSAGGAAYRPCARSRPPTTGIVSTCPCNSCSFHHASAPLRSSQGTDRSEHETAAVSPPLPTEHCRIGLECGRYSHRDSEFDNIGCGHAYAGGSRDGWRWGGDGGDPEQPDKRPATRTASTRAKTTRRAPRTKEEPPPKVDLPEWFLERAVFLPEELQARESRLEIADRFDSEAGLEEDGGAGEPGEASSGGSSGGGGPSKEVDVQDNVVKAVDATTELQATARKSKQLSEEAMQAETATEKPTESSGSPSGPDPEPIAPLGPESAVPESATPEDGTPIDPDLRRPDVAFFTPSISIDLRYGLSPAVWAEVLSTVKGTLCLPKPTFHLTKVARTVDCVLFFPQTPETNGTYFLDAVSEDLARQLGATLIRIDAEDVAEIAGDYVETPPPPGKPAASTSTQMPVHELRTLGYDAQFIHPNNRPRSEEEEEVVEETEEVESSEDGEAGGADFEDSSRPFRADNASPTSAPMVITTIFRKFFVQAGADMDGQPTVMEVRAPGSGGTSILQPQPPPASHPKLTAVLDLMLDSGIKKRESLHKTPTSTKAGAAEPTGSASSGRTIIQVRDFKELQNVTEGKGFLKILRKLVFQRRLEGREIMILGNSATVGHGTDLTASYLSVLQGGVTSSGVLERPIVVSPQPWETTRELLERDRKARIREINMRHLKAMIMRRSGQEGENLMLEVPRDWHFDNMPQVSNMSDWVWDLDQIHRLTLAILGSLPSPDKTELGPRVLGPGDVAQAIRILRRSDKAKLAWSTAEVKYAEEQEAAETEEPTAEEVRAAKLRKLKAKCSKHEKRLLGGVIDPTSIATGFSEVRAAEETVDALKTLTSLSLLRPEAFSYGVLATDKIPGVLLYGPPGTGKTLLAKAVAKESGATVLEVSGSEVYDMYVGEGEKNVKAIFSLAKKLSPCVVFIDEADAIFGARTAHHQRTSHRELINQFLKEWDGMAKMSAFIMVATNRPFDLDDAVLRRLPRRILIDLPTAADRLAILQIHLVGEMLAEDVDLSAIAADERTNLYSGSDLKNVAVAAALAAVREEDKAFKESGVYPEKRLLRGAHFEQALGEITASISDDMGSLGMIRKFDEKYGDRKGRKKTMSRWGFGEVGKDSTRERGTGRVRN
ncbi:hypothetical protein DRE_03185 [Drechslerella stenobrocha 248]|uniref:AAA+ ATPase domain-containing protein n=1 Tax=Drechslerella stenobrocha 248 TaxID=1043628 RepID=W7IEW7_9PEZI|nr:hypothetical protein DRE_03185 [Drechslerella stenobrocha 248]